MFNEYCTVLREYKSLGIIEKVEEKYDTELPVVRYLPHHPVIKWEKSKTKVRIVFDASAKDSQGVSLNDAMFSGPNLSPDVVELLIRFRMRKVVLLADIEKAFLQLSLSTQQRDFTRFF